MSPGSGRRRERRPIDWADVRRRLDALGAALDQTWEPSPAQAREVLRARARALASPVGSEGIAEPVEVVEFRLAGESYALESICVAGVFPLTELTRLPGTPAFVQGVVHVRGEIVSVVDLRSFFGLPASGITDLNKVILLQSREMAFGILADWVEGVRVIDAGALQPGLPTLGDRRRDYLKGIAEGRVVVLDAAALLADPRMVIDEEAES